MIKLNAGTFTQNFPRIGSALEHDELEAFIDLLKIQVVEASEALIMQGTQTDSLYFVWEGQLDVTLSTPQGEHKINSVGPGELLGEISLLSPGKATATVRSEQGCIALHLDVNSLETFWQSHPHAASVFLQELSRLVTRRVRTANETVNAIQKVRGTSTDKLKTAQHNLLKG